MGLFGKRKPEPEEASGGPSPDYVFAHLAMRGIALANPAQFLAIAPSPDFKKLLDPLLSDIAEDCGRPASFTSSDIQVRAGRIKPKSNPKKAWPMVVLKLPEAQNPAEVHMIGFVVFIEPGELEELPAPEEIEARYFTLEKSFTIEGVENNVLCEWQETAHLNHGTGPDRNAKEFVRAISKLL